jgi:hypothetical protein
VALSSRGAPGSIDSLADDLRTWQAERAGQEAEVGGQVVGAEATAAERRGESAMDGLPAHLDGRWPPPQVAPSLGRRIEAPAEDPTLGEVLARRDVSVLGSAADVAGRITQVLREAGWEQIPRGAILGDGAPCIWNVAEAHFPGGRQPRADSHLSEPLYAFAHLRYPKNPAGAKAWVEQQRGALLPDRVGEVLSTRKRRRPWEKALCNALAPLIGDVEHTRTRRRDQEPWHTGLAGGSGAVAGACTHGIQSRFQRAGMRWKPPGFLNVLALRLAPLHGTFQAFWASRGLTVQVPG